MISAIFIALILFLLIAGRAESLPLTETIYMIPEYDVEIYLRDEVHRTDRYSRRDSAGLGFGAVDWLSLWLQVDYLSQGPFKVDKSNIGDMFLKAKFYIGDFAGDQVHLGFMMNFRFPIGRNAYSSPDWRNLALGKYEIRLGPFARFDILDLAFIHLNLFYTFREGNGENFWGGFYFDITKKETWQKIFGLNPAEKDTFLNIERIKNDYMVASMALNTNYFYPFIPYIEAYGAFRVNRSHIDTGGVPIEGAAYNAFLLSAGIRYFFLEALYFGVYTVQNPLQASQKGFIRAIYGMELSLQI
ncbi:MAG: hypothetical protein JW807_04540 [Spirochaetes bacterium]|nr:hypothetical protein [Spirochaetota bacterium]